MSNTKFYVGQKVYDSALFPGVEGVVDEDLSGRILVAFEKKLQSYWSNGAVNINAAQTLFPEPYEVKRPEVLPEPGTFVYCWDGEVEKPKVTACGYFIGKTKERGFRVQNISNEATNWQNIALENPFPKKIEL
jgi:hypothetical protein